jgi:Ti-type conjugative transfer relaxase TraA
MISRSNGGSSVAASAYRSGQKLSQQTNSEETEAISYDYSKKSGVVFSQIFAPTGASKWCYDRETLWNKVEQAETRKDAQLAREIDLALQLEFTLEQNIELITNFVESNFIAKGMIADVNFHYDNPDNPHAHIMLTTRELLVDQDGISYFGKKVRNWNDKSWLLSLRKNWADLNNQYFKLYNIDKTITHESYVTRGIELQSTIHKGSDKYEKIAKAKSNQNEQIISSNLEYIRDHPLAIIKALSRKHPVFSAKSITKELNNFLTSIAKSDSDEVKQGALKQFDELFAHLTSNLVTICEQDLRGDKLFTTQTQIELEQRFFANLAELSAKCDHTLKLDNITTKAKFSPNIILDAFSKHPKQGSSLSAEQEQAILSIANGANLSLLIGRPGTGKTMVMSTLVSAYRAKGYKVWGAAYSASASGSLAESAKITAHTIAKWQYDWQLRDSEIEEAKGDKLLPKLTSKDVLIVDEVSMVNLEVMDYLLTQAKTAGCKVILIGDDQQFNAPELGGVAEKLVEKLPSIKLTEVYRQIDEIDKQITNHLSEEKVGQAILLLKSSNKIVLYASNMELKQAIVNDYLEKITSNKTQEIAILAFSNKQVSALNNVVRTRLIDSGILQTMHYQTKGKELPSSNGSKAIAIGERIVFTKNHKKLGIINGQLAIVTKIREGNNFDVELLGNNKTLTINLQYYNHFDYGYVITAYKSQGKSYDYSLALIDKNVGYEAFNVMATRHREGSKFYLEEKTLEHILANKSKNKSLMLTGQNKDAALFELLTRRDYSNFAHDYLGFNDNVKVTQIRDYIKERDQAANLYKRMLGDNYNSIFEHPLWGKFKQHQEQQEYVAKEIVLNFKDYRKYLSNSNINYSTLLSHAKLNQMTFEYGQEKPPSQTPELRKIFQEIIKRIDTNSSFEQAENLLAKSEIGKAELSIAKQEQKKLQEKIWQSKSNIKANEYLQQDFKTYLSHIFKEDPTTIISKLETCVNKENPSSLGKFKGIGIDKHFALTYGRAVASKQLESWVPRLNSYESSKNKIALLTQELAGSQAQEELLTVKIKLLSNNTLTTKQELRLLKILETKGSQTTTNSNDKSKIIKQHKTSIAEIYYQLTAKLDLLASQLLPKIVGKEIVIHANYYKCGSLFLSKEQGRQGLWHRFSSNEGGNLFDLIKQAEHLSDTRQAINWSKEWLGIDYHQVTQVPIVAKPKMHTNANLQIFKIVPEYAASLNLKQNLYYKFKNQDNRLEAVYEYRNINNQLCGYVVRIVIPFPINKYTNYIA